MVLDRSKKRSLTKYHGKPGHYPCLTKYHGKPRRYRWMLAKPFRLAYSSPAAG